MANEQDKSQSNQDIVFNFDKLLDISSHQMFLAIQFLAVYL